MPNKLVMNALEECAPPPRATTWEPQKPSKTAMTTMHCDGFLMGPLASLLTVGRNVSNLPDWIKI